MDEGSVLERHDRLPPGPESASAARKLTAAAIGASSLASTGVADTAVLLVSEVTTNAILHAGGYVDLHVRVEPTKVRIQVRDCSVVVPVISHYDDGAATGRGMELVELLASAWGSHQEPNGKIVWFEVSIEPEPATDSDDRHGATEPGPMWTSVELLAAPTTLLQETIEHSDAVLRELALLSMTEQPDMVANLYRPPRIDLSGVLTAVEAALAGGLTEVDLTIDFPPSAEEGASDRLAIVEGAQKLIDAGLLLTLPSTPEISACRRWLMGEITAQLQGTLPTAWRRLS